MRTDAPPAPTLAPARLPVQRPPDARLLLVDARGDVAHLRRSQWTDCVRPGDVVVANDAATLPASLRGIHVPSQRRVELRLAGHVPRAPDGATRYDVVVFGEGDWRTRTEDRPVPPRVSPGDRLVVGDVAIVIEALLDHPRLARVRFDATPVAVWSLLAHHGRPIQYAHLDVALELWDAWTAVAATPVAFEAPSAGFVLDWHGVQALRARGAAFATLTHAAGISSTGDAVLDARLPLPEPYAIPHATARAVERARNAHGRVIAIGTTVVRALEHAAARDGTVRAGAGVADQRIARSTPLRVVDALLTGTHEPGTTHYALLGAFTDGDALARAAAAMADYGYRTHEYGDSMLVERRRKGVP